jgi:hypothetical protein
MQDRPRACAGRSPASISADAPRPFRPEIAENVGAGLRLGACLERQLT